jgi:hypothetical protein
MRTTFDTMIVVAELDIILVVPLLSFEGVAMSRHRVCITNDQDGSMGELAQELWEERHGDGGREAYSEECLRFRKLFAEQRFTSFAGTGSLADDH